MVQYANSSLTFLGD